MCSTVPGRNWLLYGVLDSFAVFVQHLKIYSLQINVLHASAVRFATVRSYVNKSAEVLSRSPRFIVLCFVSLSAETLSFFNISLSHWKYFPNLLLKSFFRYWQYNITYLFYYRNVFKFSWKERVLLTIMKSKHLDVYPQSLSVPN